MDTRVFALTSKYSIVCTAGGQRQLSPEEAGRRLLGPVASGGHGSSAGSSSGCQENYLVGMRGEFGRLAGILIPFLVTRQLICGAGAVVQTHGLYYQLQRGNAVDRTSRDIDVFEAKTVPPAPGRYRQTG